jgi:hypothetical protein
VYIGTPTVNEARVVDAVAKAIENGGLFRFVNLEMPVETVILA